MHKEAHILRQAGDLLRQVLDKVEGAVDVSLNLNQRSTSVPRPKDGQMQDTTAAQCS